jgi:endonuclease/exonuclease/phosphatase family metal-dependent hydrolase
MPQVRVATFNVENLLQRFDFYRYGQLTKEPALELLGVESDQEGMRLRKSLHVALTDDSRQMTAQAIRDTKADIICLQEVDSRDILDDFNNYYLKRSADVHYGWRRLIDGNDRRGIDVAVMSKSRIYVTSHADITFADFGLWNNQLDDYGLSEGDRIFRRDCLEVRFPLGDDTDLTLFVCHFKSMSNGRDDTKPVREAEAKAVRRIIEEKFDNDTHDANWLIVGDLNDYTHLSNGTPVVNSLEPLFDGGFAVNLLDNLPAAERWTNYYPKGKSFSQIDYILASPGIAGRNPGVQPDIIRGGQPYRVPNLEGTPRFPRVGFDRPKASDHCPVAVTLNI